MPTPGGMLSDVIFEGPWLATRDLPGDDQSPRTSDAAGTAPVTSAHAVGIEGAELASDWHGAEPPGLWLRQRLSWPTLRRKGHDAEALACFLPAIIVLGFTSRVCRGQHS